jgi:hypothetical protein
MDPRSLARPLTLLAGIVLVLAACSSGTATTAPTQAAATPTTVPPTEPPTSQAAPASGGPSFALPSFTADKDLESLFPKQINGKDLQVISVSGSDFLTAGSAPELQQVLTQLGKQPSDLSVAFGGTEEVSVIAYRIKGVPAAQSFGALLQAYGKEIDATVSDASFGGKSVKKAVPKDTTEDTTYIYTSNDVVFVVGPGGADAISDALLNETFSKLP